jgi:flavin reductase (DIM6/NTAB) family NADH-FMN oxidoreductase RutF/DNA-binding MarR family transcriptional regulator
VVGPFRRDPVEEGDPAADSKAFRRCLGQFSTGVDVMTTVANGEPVGVTANSFSSLSMDPPLVLWSIAHNSRSCEAFKNAKHFAINILAVEQVEYSQRFARPAQNKFEDVDWRPGVLGSPILPNVLASLECAPETTLQGGDHVIMIGRVKKYSRYAGNALLYAQGRYAVAEDHPSLQLKPSNVAKTDAKLNVSDMRLMALLAYVEMYASEAFDKYRQSQGLNITQSRILFALSGGNQLSLEEVIARSFLPRDSAEDALDSLTERGCVAGQPRAFALTESGRNLFTRLIAQLGKFEAEQFSGISQQDLAVTRRVLEKLYDRLRPS